ncbi:MAG: tetratricopeptide repeat protein [Nitrospirae bacterium]|nr:tetratricopeptide repeat protein [Nitrospirota bacterium]
MPKAIKKRITKKTTLQEEEVKGIISHAMDFVREKKKTFILVSSIVGAAAAVYIIVMLYTASLANKAYALEKEAFHYYYGINLKSPMLEDERLKKALELYQQSLKVKSTPIALFYLGNCYYKLNDYTNAAKSYTSFIDKYPGEEGMLPLVYQKLAYSYVNNGKAGDAIKTLQTLEKFKNGVFKDTALIQQARLHETLGKPEDAKKKYEELIKEFPGSIWSAEARSKIGADLPKEEKPQ